MKFHGEAFLPDFGMIEQRAVCETEFLASAMIFNQVSNPAGIERPESEVRYEDADRGTDLYRRVRPAKFKPRYLEHPPAPKRMDRAFKYGSAASQLDTIVVNGVSVRSAITRSPHVCIRKGLVLLCG